MRTIYMIYAKIPSTLYHDRFKFIFTNKYNFIESETNKGMVIGLYAWTNKKSILKEFLYQRNNKTYIVEEKEIDFKELRLNLHDFITFDKNKNCKTKIGCITTFDEYFVCTEQPSETIHEFIIDIYSELHVSVFKSEIFKCLEVLGYVSSYFLNYGNDNEANLSYFNLSYGLSPNGYTIITRNSVDELKLLFILYKYLFYGDFKEKPEYLNKKG